MKSVWMWNVVLFLIGCIAPLRAAAQDPGGEARRILDRMLEQHQERVAGIEKYRVETDSYVAHYTKTDSEWPSFTMRVEAREGAPRQIEQAASVSDPSLFDRDVFEKLREQAVYAGRQMLNGRPKHGIRADRMRARVHVRGPGGQMQTVTATVLFEEYRDIEGLRLPYLTTVTLDGLGDGISDADRERARQALRQLEQVPPEQRALVESMMQGQIEQARQVLAGEPVTLETVIRRVEVNTGTP